jgi:membrane-associated phospholipid phosphatase
MKFCRGKIESLPCFARGIGALLLALNCVAWTHDVAAQSPYDLETKREWFLLGGGAVLGISALAVINSVEPLTYEEIAALDPEDINGFDRDGVQPYRDTHAGDALLYASFVLPLTLLGPEETRADWKILGVMWAETVLLSAGINGVVKGLASRTRPYVYDPQTPEEKKLDRDARLSFYSGHTSATAANCFFVAKVFNDYLENRAAKAAIWTGAAVYPALTGYLRRDSGHHFRTDVIVGYCIGALVGYFVPELHRVKTTDRFSIYPAPLDGSVGLGMRVAF